MSDYISREEVIEKIRYEGIYGSGYSDKEREDDVIDMIESIPAAEVIPLGVELWSDRFEIKRRWWRSEDGEHMADSFMIVRKEDNK